MKCPSISELPPAPEGKTGWPWTEESEPIALSGKLPKISIVTPSFNQGEFIEETIRAVLLQGYSDIEYIVCDGGSSDDTVSIIKKYEKWISSWVSEPDNGQSNAINKGFKIATGDIVAWINSDDFYEKGALWNVAKTYIQNQKYSVIYGNCLNFSSKGTILTIPYKGEYSRKLLLKGQYFQQPASFFNRSYIHEIGYINEKFHYCMDYDMFFRLCEKGPVAYVNATLARFRYQDNSKTVSQNYKFLLEILQIFDNHLLNKPLSTEEVEIVLTRSFWSAIKLLAFGLDNLRLDEIQNKNISTMSTDEWISYLLHWISSQMNNSSKISKKLIKEIYKLFSERYDNCTIPVNSAKRHHEYIVYKYLQHHSKISEGFGVSIITYYPDSFRYRKRVLLRYLVTYVLRKQRIWEY